MPVTSNRTEPALTTSALPSISKPATPQIQPAASPKPLAWTNRVTSPAGTPSPASASSPPATSRQGEFALPDLTSSIVSHKPADSHADNITNNASNDAVSASVDESRRLYIGNLAWAATEEDLQSFFKGYLIKSSSIPKNPRTDRAVGYAFVDLSTTDEAERAIAELSGKKMLDRVISVQIARKPERDVEKNDSGRGEASSGGEGGRLPSTNGVHCSSSTPDQALEAALQAQVRAEAESHDPSEEDMDIEGSYAPDPARLAPASGSDSVVEASISAIPGSPARMDDGEAPAVSLTTVQHLSTIDMELDADEDDDDYEPPDATPTVDMPSLVESLPLSSASPKSVADFEQISFSSGDLEATAEHSGELRVNGSVRTEVKHSYGPSFLGLLIVQQGSAQYSDLNQFFTPYESPLKYFRAFRFHPDYKQQVSGGLKSVTYSHKIDPNTELCRYELAGGSCNDKTCEFQHFRDIVLPGASVEQHDLDSFGIPSGPQG